jgi:hypothetical protein
MLRPTGARVIQNRKTVHALHLALGLCLTFFSSARALSLDLYHGNIYYDRDDRVDTLASETARRNNFYEDIGLSLQNLGSTGLSFSSDVSMTTDKLTHMARQYDIRSTSLDWENRAAGLGASLGRQFVNNFARDAGYLDGLSLAWDKGHLALSAFVGTAMPSPYSDSIVKITALKAVEAGFFGAMRVAAGTEIGLGASADIQDESTRPYRLAASLKSDLGHTVAVRGHARYEISRQSLDEYFLQARFIPLDIVRLSLHAAGRAQRVDSVDYYERIFLDKYNEGGMAVGLYPAQGISLDGAYSLREFGAGADHLASCNIAAKGAALLLGANAGVHGTMYRIMPAYTFTCAQLFELGASFEFNRYSTQLAPDWRNAITALAFMRWFVPWLTPGVSLVLEPQVEYLSNDYFKKDVRVMFLSIFNFHVFRQSGPEATGREN